VAAAQRRSARLFRLVAIVLVLGLVASGIGAGLALVQKSRANHAAFQAALAALEAKAASQFLVDPRGGAILALEAARLRKATGGSTAAKGSSRMVAELSNAIPAITPSAAWSSNGTRILTLGKDGRVRVWDTATGHALATLPAKRVSVAALTQDGSVAVTGGLGGAVGLYDASSGRLIRRMQRPSAVRASVVDLAINRNGTAVSAIVGNSNLGTVWSTSTGEIVGIVGGIFGQIFHDIFAPQGWILTAGKDSLSQSGFCGSRVTRGGGGGGGNPLGYVFGVDLSPDGKQVVVERTGSASLIDLWGPYVNDCRGPNSQGEMPLLQQRGGALLDASFDAAGARVVAGSTDGTARIFDVRASKASTQQQYNQAPRPRQLAVLRGHAGAVLDAEFSPDGKLVVTAGADGTAREWDAANGTQVRVFSVSPSDVVITAAFSPDGTRILTETASGQAQVWNAATGKLEFTLTQ
jgi:WD40 repeat protein